MIAALLARFQGVMVAITAALTALAVIFYRGKSAGREQAETKQREVNDETRRRMESIKPATSSSTIDSLHNGDF